MIKTHRPKNFVKPTFRPARLCFRLTWWKERTPHRQSPSTWARACPDCRKWPAKARLGPRKYQNLSTFSISFALACGRRTTAALLDRNTATSVSTPTPRWSKLTWRKTASEQSPAGWSSSDFSSPHLRSNSTGYQNTWPNLNIFYERKLLRTRRCDWIKTDESVKTPCGSGDHSSPTERQESAVASVRLGRNFAFRYKPIGKVC